MSREVVRLFVPVSLIAIAFYVVPPPPALGQDSAASCSNYITVIAENGLVIGELNADEPRAPASMVKMILMLIVSEGLESGRWTLEQTVVVTKRASELVGTRVFLKEGESCSLEQLMKAVSVASANDAALAVAEGLWGSESDYLLEANKRAIELGMNSTRIRSVHGLPPDTGQLPDESSARDLAILASACVGHPLIMQWAGMRQLEFRPGDEPKASTNKLLEIMPECDGLKTGYTRAAGFCMTATATRDGVRLITVVMGCPKLADRFTTARQLLEEGFAETRRVLLFAKGDTIDTAVRVRNARTPDVPLTAAEDVWITAKETDLPQLEYVPDHPLELMAPLREGEVVGKMDIQLAGYSLAQVDLIVPEPVEEAGIWWKLTHGVVQRFSS